MTGWHLEFGLLTSIIYESQFLFFKPTSVEWFVVWLKKQILMHIITFYDLTSFKRTVSPVVTTFLSLLQLFLLFPQVFCLIFLPKSSDHKFLLLFKHPCFPVWLWASLRSERISGIIADARVQRDPGKPVFTASPTALNQLWPQITAFHHPCLRFFICNPEMRAKPVPAQVTESKIWSMSKGLVKIKVQLNS